MAKSLSIVGGGPAGLACGIRLRERGWDVTVIERGRYPLRKVCGEFLSPGGWARLQGLGAGPYLPHPPRPLRRARFYADARAYADFELDPPAWGLRRAALDSALAARFRALGGRLEEGRAWRPEEGAGSAPLDARGRGVGARTGPWMAWRGSLAGADAPAELGQADLLMLPLEGGYVGLNWVDDGSVNVCLVARRDRSLPGLLRGHPLLAALAPRIKAQAAIAGFALAAQAGPGLLGDRGRVWPPLVGDGIRRALASGEAAAQALDEGGPPARGGWDGLQFGLALALHHGMLRPRLRRPALALLAARPAWAARLYRWTRA